MELELTPEQAVKNGAEWLDKVYPEWWTRVDVGTLDIMDANTCICGQIFSENDCKMGYINIIYLARSVSSPSTVWIEDHGFAGADKVFNPLWVAEIKHRADIGLVD